MTLPPTSMMVNIGVLGGHVDYVAAFWMIEMTPMPLSLEKGVPWIGFAGPCVSAKVLIDGKAYYRGYPDCKAPFKNGGTFNVATSTCVANLKLSNYNVQTSGTPSDTSTLEAMHILTDKLRTAHERAVWGAKHPDLARELIALVAEATCGQTQYYLGDTNILVNADVYMQCCTGMIDVNNVHPYQLVYGYRDTTLALLQSVQSTPSILVGATLEDLLKPYADHVEIAGIRSWLQLLLSYRIDYQRHDIYVADLYNLLQITSVYTGNLRVKALQRSLTNHTYNFGFEIDRRQLADALNGYDEFIATYDDSVGGYVEVHLPYCVPVELQPRLRTRIKDGMRPHISFRIYHTGTVAQSGPCEEINYVGYIRLMRAVANFLGQIIKPQDTINISFSSELQLQRYRQAYQDVVAERKALASWFATHTDTDPDPDIVLLPSVPNDYKIQA